MTLLSKDQIFAGDDRQYEVVPVPEWNHLVPAGEVAEVRLRSLTGTERDAYEEGMLRQNGKKTRADLKNMRAKLVALCAVNDQDQLLFDRADVLRLGQRNAAALDRLYETCNRLSGLSDEDVEELEEDFDSAPSGPSTSDSPPTSASPSANSSPVPVPMNSPGGWPTNGSTAHSVPNAPITTPR